MSVRKTTHTETVWTGDKWDLDHAIDFWRKGHWTLEFAALWLGVTTDELYDMATQTCPKCKGNGTIWKEAK